jgi:hypothetical protein
MADVTQILNVKETPRRVDKLPVAKAVFLGWLPRHRQEPGYFAYVLTYGREVIDGKPGFRGHLLWAPGMDRNWRTLETHDELTRNEALAKFADHEKLAIWPEGS